MPILLLTALTALGGLTFVLASLLILANRKLYVVEDPRIETVDNLLPQANCGGCGFPSCRAFAEALVGGLVAPSKCQVSSEGQRASIAAFLNVAVGNDVKRIARLACAGGSNVAENRAHYVGPPTCVAANQVGGGHKACSWGCLGFGDCARVCEFDAIHMDNHGLPVVDENRCTACGDCVAICPKDLFSLQPLTHQLWVACNSRQQGDTVLAACQVGCTACGRCVADARDQHITLHDNLPAVDYDKSLAGQEAIERCPTGAIVWLSREGQVLKGHGAKVVLRTTPLPDAST